MFLPKKQKKKPKQNQFQTPFKLCTLAKQMDLTAASTVARLVTAVFYVCADLSFYFLLDVGPCNILCVNVLRPAWTLNTLSFLCFWWFFFCLFVYLFSFYSAVDFLKLNTMTKWSYWILSASFSGQWTKPGPKLGMACFLLNGISLILDMLQKL